LAIIVTVNVFSFAKTKLMRYLSNANQNKQIVVLIIMISAAFISYLIISMLNYIFLVYRMKRVVYIYT